MLQIDHGLHHLFAIQHHHIGSARRIHRRALQGEGPYRRFIRLMQGNFAKPGIRLEFRRGFDNGHRVADFRCRERV